MLEKGLLINDFLLSGDLLGELGVGVSDSRMLFCLDRIAIFKRSLTILSQKTYFHVFVPVVRLSFRDLYISLLLEGII